MSYHIYENWVAHGHSARVHLSECPFCNDGKGIHPNVSDDNGRWHWPFKTLLEATLFAQIAGCTVFKCRCCKP